MTDSAPHRGDQRARPRELRKRGDDYKAAWELAESELTALREEVERVRNEALELAAQEAEKDAFAIYGDPDAKWVGFQIAANIRKLKSSGQPSQEPESA
jgi:hypothetical protein